MTTSTHPLRPSAPPTDDPTQVIDLREEPVRGHEPPAPPKAREASWWRRPRTYLLGALALLLLLVGYLGITFVQVWHASRQDHHQPAAAIVVMGAAQYDGRPSPVLQARLDRAHELYEQGLAPLLVTTESRVLASQMGQVVVVVEAEQTQQGAVKQALATIEACPIKLMMLNKTRSSSAGSGYGYGYGYSYGYGS